MFSECYKQLNRGLFMLSEYKVRTASRNMKFASLRIQ